LEGLDKIKEVNDLKKQYKESLNEICRTLQGLVKKNKELKKDC
jgi:hypothetical protein